MTASAFIWRPLHIGANARYPGEVAPWVVGTAVGLFFDALPECYAIRYSIQLYPARCGLYSTMNGGMERSGYRVYGPARIDVMSLDWRLVHIRSVTVSARFNASVSDPPDWRTMEKRFYLRPTLETPE